VRLATQRCTPCDSAPVHASRSLQRRWEHLLARQESFLNTTPQTMAPVAAPAAGLP
jgi:hypothetical protein